MVAFAIQIAAFLFLCFVGFWLLIAAVCAVGWVVAAFANGLFITGKAFYLLGRWIFNLIRKVVAHA